LGQFKGEFSKGDYFRILDLLQEIHSMRQGERNVTQFFTNLKILWEELESLRPIPCCICEIPWRCTLSKISLQYRDSEYVVYFLKGLAEIYNTVKTQILMMEPLPNINNVFTLAIQQERQITGIHTSTDTKILFNSNDKQSDTWRQQDQSSWKHGSQNRDPQRKIV